MWSFALSVSAQEQEEQTGGRCYLLANVKKKWEITHVELIELTLDKLIWHMGPCRAWPFNLLKIWIKLNWPRETSGHCLIVGPWRVLSPVKKKSLFSWSNGKCMENLSSSCSFHLLLCLLSFQLSTAAIREVPYYETVPRATKVLFPSTFLEGKSDTVLGCDAFGCPLLNRGYRKGCSWKQEHTMQQLCVQHQG